MFSERENVVWAIRLQSWRWKWQADRWKGTQPAIEKVPRTTDNLCTLRGTLGGNKNTSGVGG